MATTIKKLGVESWAANSRGTKTIRFPKNGDINNGFEEMTLTPEMEDYEIAEAIMKGCPVCHFFETSEGKGELERLEKDYRMFSKAKSTSVRAELVTVDNGVVPLGVAPGLSMKKGPSKFDISMKLGELIKDPALAMSIVGSPTQKNVSDHLEEIASLLKVDADKKEVIKALKALS